MKDDAIPSSERLFRNLHPTDYDNGRINSRALNPSSEHGYELSVDRSSIFDAATSFREFTAKGLESIGVCGLLCDDFVEESIPCASDPLPDNAAHALADYSMHGTNQRRKKAKRLAKKALDYGLDYEA